MSASGPGAPGRNWPPEFRPLLGQKFRILLLVNGPALAGLLILGWLHHRGAIRFKPLPEGMAGNIALFFVAVGFLAITAWIVMPWFEFQWRYLLFHARRGLLRGVVLALPLAVSWLLYVAAILAAYALALLAILVLALSVWAIFDR